MTDAVVRPARPEDVPGMAAIVRRSPEHFTGDVPGKGERDAAAHGAWVLAAPEGPVGFAVVERRPPAAAEMLWLAVDPPHRGRGLGTALVDRVLDELAAEGVRVVEAKTLAPGTGYAPYEVTRAFWERRGFVHVDTIDPLPGWPAGNPAAIHVAALRPTRRRAPGSRAPTMRDACGDTTDPASRWRRR